ncbi:hypothetical protein HU200_038383 [Digitaria exilis]|uniref:Uncharacterized protein n=1 Tax=Digitaria exilis TaxID=1010633 RepID=A0A835EKI4_9POAL|nr:hypothetical protein HU200_038383 [Digitaria exilis]
MCFSNKLLHFNLSFRNSLINLIHRGFICNRIPYSNTETSLKKPVVDKPLRMT